MKKRISFDSAEEAVAVLGTQDRNIKLIRDCLGIEIVARGEALSLEGEARQVEKALSVLEALRSRYREAQRLSSREVEDILDALERSEGRFSDTHRIMLPSRGRFITPRTEGQRRYVETIRNHDIVFCIGPAGTGKTYIAVAMALSRLREGKYQKIVLARPAVEAGEKLGFLPGDIEEKVNPYLRPIYDALEDMMDYSLLRKYLERDIIEVVPLAFMRGRTLSRAFIILDEAQNCTLTQMKMFLTRLGEHSKAVITGDITQIDLPREIPSGLVHACRLFRNIEGIAVVSLSKRDIVRHKLVHYIVEAYERYENREKAQEGPAEQGWTPEAPHQ